MGDNARGVHVSPGIYTREIDAQYAIRSLGITSLGLVGETQKGPAFQVMNISNWRDFEDMFGGTSTEEFKGSKYPKYELPYIAKSYLTESEQLKVVRVLGLGGYNAGPAWVVTASKSGETEDRKVAVAVIRSRGHYNYYNMNDNDSCQCEKTKFDILEYEVGEKKESTEQIGDICKAEEYNMNALQIKEYIPYVSLGDECKEYKVSGSSGSFNISQDNKGRFKLVGVKGKKDINEIQGIIDSEDIKDKLSKGYFEYAVSLNPQDKDYIINVLGENPSDGDTPIYVETLYDVSLGQEIVKLNVNTIDSGLTTFNVYKTADYCQHIPVDGMVRMQQNQLNRRMLGQRFLADKESIELDIDCSAFGYETNEPMLIKDYFDDVEKQKLIKNDRPTGDFFEFKYRAPITTQMPTQKEYEHDGETDTYYQRDARHLSPYDVSGYSVTFLSKIVKVLTIDSPSVTISGSPKPIWVDGKEESGTSAYTYTISSATKSYSKDIVGNAPTITAKIKSTEHDKSVPTTSSITTNRNTIYSSTTYTYGSQGKAAVPAETMGSGVIFLSGPTETALYKTWSNQNANLAMQVGQIYTVKQYIDLSGKINYLYAFYDANDVSASTSGMSDMNLTNAYGNLLSGGTSGNTNDGSMLVFNKENDRYYKMNSATTEDEVDVEYVQIDMNDYMSPYSNAVTPWIVSNIKGDYKNMELNKMFRFHTISDGNNANHEVKVSIENIRPDDGMFDVVVRRIDDLDESIIPLEKFSKCCL